jgi:DNA-binding transcriptional ArsR family regulator
MPKAKADLILHPVRMRLLMALARERRTAQQLSEVLSDVPQATLYRHINQLASAGIITVVEERPVRGTIEKVYTLASQSAFLSPEDMAGHSSEDQMRYFTTFVVTLLDDFAVYLKHYEQPDLARDQVGYQKILLNLSDAEIPDFARALNQALLPFAQFTPTPERKPRIFSTVFIPAEADPTEE